MQYRDYLRTRLKGLIPDKAALPDGFHLVGHVALLHLDSSLLDYAHLIGSATLGYDGRIKSVAVRSGPTEGVLRIPTYVLVAGEPNTVTTHVEGGVKYRLDPLIVTFSGGNRCERIRLRSVVSPGEIVVDMFACVGQFALPIATGKSSQVFAIEINPVAYGYLLENIRLNRVENKVVALLGDCREVHPSRVADRVVMGYLHNTLLYLPAALETLSAKGGIIHMHMAAPTSEAASIESGISYEARHSGFMTQTVVRRIKSYSPGVNHMVFDIRATPD